MDSQTAYVILGGTITCYLLSVNISNYNRTRDWSKAHRNTDFALYEERMRNQDVTDLLSFINTKLGLLGRTVARKLHERRKES